MVHRAVAILNTIKCITERKAAGKQQLKTSCVLMGHPRREVAKLIIAVKVNSTSSVILHVLNGVVVCSFVIASLHIKQYTI